MDGYELLLLLPPALALAAAWFSSRAIKKSAAAIDRRRDELHVLKEQALMRQNPPVERTAPMRPTPAAH
ncbi:hypothetical protein FV232_26170 [Methylobacterium sp. WL30]|uniref:hypothetical protein n=1 Tax=unclassified Methylobacterium TaxID=2615210 RepID=UPI0011C7C90F|nr:MULTISPECIES: hypothetical protein [unclassified Methylobacterium]TXM94910.1 hypothetical protein FV223_02910 [Methylobacterium sp. WL116]TXN39335.1 hypothetical protein FV225_10125 [Methylobacterium sp. WL93]TXN45800.1 hypothetical protein FV227_24525 [Methylobacterium sp. WL119]TXN62066.1 hypothetical protein FV232_26170 [Methylobacterium sp. WL30]